MCPIECYWSKCSPDGSAWWLLWKPWASSIGKCAQCSTALPRPSKWSTTWTHFALSFCLLSLWWPPGQYGSSHPMAAFSGFYESFGPPPLGDAPGIAPLHRHGYQNGQQQRYICLLLQPLSFDQNIAKRHCYGPFKLTPSYYINVISVISLFVSYWPPPLTMDTVLVTIVAGGQAQYWQHTEASLN